VDWKFVSGSEIVVSGRGNPFFDFLSFTKIVAPSSPLFSARVGGGAMASIVRILHKANTDHFPPNRVLRRHEGDKNLHAKIPSQILVV
jgi:hypothetical protein